MPCVGAAAITGNSRSVLDVLWVGAIHHEVVGRLGGVHRHHRLGQADIAGQSAVGLHREGHKIGNPAARAACTMPIASSMWVSV